MLQLFIYNNLAYSASCIIKDIPSIVKDSLSRALSLVNIQNCFKTTRINPFNRNIFQDDDFLSCYTPDRTNIAVESPLPSTVPNTSRVESPLATCVPAIFVVQSQPMTCVSTISGVESRHIEPEMIRRFPKATPRKERVVKKRHLTTILTSFPKKKL